MMSKERLRLENVGYEVQVNTKGVITTNNILSDISFTLKEKAILGITGESGGGKTTLVKIIAGLIRPTRGSVFYKSDSVEKQTGNRIQILFQNNGDVLNPFRIVGRVIDEALEIRIKDKNERAEYKQKILAAVDFSENLLERKGYQLSGGEQQRAALLRLLAVQPELLILDEPFSAQDFESQISFMKLFKDINEKFGTTIICISHDVHLLKALADEVIVMYKSKIVEHKSTQELFSNPGHSYTKYLIKANNLTLTEEELRKSF